MNWLYIIIPAIFILAGVLIEYFEKGEDFSLKDIIIDLVKGAFIGLCVAILIRLVAFVFPIVFAYIVSVTSR